MTLHVLEVPDEQKHWPAWLEQHLVGLHLGRLIEELDVLNAASGAAATRQSLNTIIDADGLARVAEAGLSGLTAEQLQTLLKNPASLLDLQAHVLLTGGEYWAGVPRSAELREAFARAQHQRRTANEIDQVPVTTQPVMRTSRRNWQSITGLLVTAAMMLLGVGLWLQQPDGGRVLGQPGLTANNVDSSAEYFHRIADAGQTWFDEQPQDAAELVVLLQEVSRDCQVLIDAPHEALSAAERDWFRTKCQNWKVKFDDTLAALESGTMTFADAKAQSDQVMTKLVDVLRAGPAV